MWNLKEFEHVYDRYKLSGLRVKDFCLNEFISENRFYYWQKKCKDLQRKSEQPSGFVPIVFNNSPAQLNNSLYGNKPISGSQLPTGNLIEIVYPNGVIVRMPLGTGIKQLESLILLSR